MNKKKNELLFYILHWSCFRFINAISENPHGHGPIRAPFKPSSTNTAKIVVLCRSGSVHFPVGQLRIVQLNSHFVGGFLPRSFPNLHFRPHRWHGINRIKCDLIAITGSLFSFERCVSSMNFNDYLANNNYCSACTIQKFAGKYRLCSSIIVFNCSTVLFDNSASFYF